MSKPRKISEIIEEMVRETSKSATEAMPYSGGYTWRIFEAMENVESEMRGAK